MATCGAAVVSFVALTLLAVAGLAVSLLGAVMLVVLFASTGVAALLMRRLIEGHGIAEPLASQYVLGSRCREVPALPELHEVVEVASARALRDLAESQRLPVLRHEDAGAASITYLTIDRQGTAYRWQPVFKEVGTRPAGPD